MEALLELLKNLSLTTVLQGLATLLVLYVLPYLVKNLPVGTQSVFTWLKNRAAHVKSQYLSGILQRVIDLLAQQVLALENTAIEDLKEAAADGKLTKEELKAALAKVKQTALDNVKMYATAQGLWDLLQHIFLGDKNAVAMWLDHQLEALVAKLPPSGLQTPATPGTLAAMTKGGRPTRVP